jgi:hypothetical protein
LVAIISSGLALTTLYFWRGVGGRINPISPRTIEND